MNMIVVQGIFGLVGSVMQWLIAKQEGNAVTALDILRSTDMSAFGFDDDTLESINIARAGLGYLSRRGLPVKETTDLILLAQSEDRDVTDDELAVLFQGASLEMGQTRNMIAELKKKEEEKAAAAAAKADDSKKQSTSKKASK